MRNFQGAQQVLIPLQVEAIDAAHKLSHLALITTLCSATAVVGLVSGGAASDVTGSRWGRRTPWLVGMASGSALLLVALGASSRLYQIVACAALLWFTLNFFQAVLLAVVPDRVPPTGRALASWAFGFAGPFGALIGINVAALAAPSLGYELLAALLTGCTALFVLLAPEAAYVRAETPNPTAPRPRNALTVLARLGESFAVRDFAFAFAARALLFLAQYVVTGYLLYAMQDYVGAASLPGGSPEIAIGVFNTVRTLVTIASLIVTGWLVQQTEHRRVFFIAYAVLMAIALAFPAFSATWSAMLAYATLGGAAFGVFASVDLAIVSHVLPSRESAGRDIGILAVATAMPQLFAPLIGAMVIASFGYASLFALAAALTLAAGLVASRLQSVK
jgi:MFS family permease